jgi:hypothetical protein
MHCGQIEFLTANGIHFFTQDLHDLEGDSLAQREIGINACRQLTNHTGAQQEFMGDDFGVSRIFSKGWDEKL